MGNGMNKVLPGLYIGNFRDSKDREQLTTHGITHILAIHDNAKKLHEDMNYLCIPASDSPHQNLTQHFRKSIKFIHESRLGGGACLIHCLAGVSRSVTVAAAYVMTVTNLGWRDTLKAIRQARAVANPNFGFQRQLQEFDAMRLSELRKWLRQKYPHSPFSEDEEAVKELLRGRG
ncbi:dual specificity protein phosphatase 22-like isoform X3 [Branchiostoma lanceolatum]|uniref:dual specificity protein phosphatase 22-like isoform X3 n=1 Tax=Branchiostoma lanceolatum TaxID=7740 RepID=UPI003453F92B